jgi:ribosomal protein L32
MAHRLQAFPERPQHGRATVIDCRPGFEGPYFQGAGSDDSVCGHCGRVLIRGRLTAYLNLYLCCPSCGKYNLAHGGEDVGLA